VNADALAAARELCAAGRTLAAQGLAPGTSGNVSLRVAGGYVMSPTNAALGELVPERISLLDERGEHAGGDAPTKERALHIALYERRPDARAIVHTHSTNAVALACLCEVDPENVLLPLTPYALMRVGRLVLAPYARPGSGALVERVAARAGDSHAILLSNHGPIVAGPTVAAAVAAVCEIEEAAKVQMLVHGRDVRLLSAADIAELAASS
jgi:ribulose-5-phosphate 4-epimerase/fuculose-1-phosphate aldolase